MTVSNKDDAGVIPRTNKSRLVMTNLSSCLIPDEEVEELLASYHIIDPELTSYGSVPSPSVSYDLYTKSSSTVAFFHIVCVMAGTGVLGLPYALKLGGWLALLWIFLSAFLVYFSGKFTINCLYHDGLNRLNGIIEIGEAALGKIGKRLVELIFASLIIGACGLYLILAANNLVLLDRWIGLSIHNWIIICTLISCFPFIGIKTLKEAAWLSFFGVMTTVIMVIVVLYVTYNDYSNPKNLPTHSPLSVSQLPLALASISFSFGGNSSFAHVEHSMQNPKQFPNALKYSLIFVSIIYCLIASMGYLAYGNDTLSPIFNNLSKSNIVDIAIIMLTVHVLLAIPINLTSFAIEAEHSFGLSSSNFTPGQQSVYRICFRMLISIVMCTFAALLPYFNHVMALLGALSNGIIVFILPPLCHAKLFGWRNLTKSDKLFSILLLVIGTFVVITGTIEALIALKGDILHSIYS